MSPLRRDWIASPNYSGRSAAGVRLIVLHTAEGALTYQSLGNYFASSSAEVSSHVGIDDTPGVVGEYVQRDPSAAWTAGSVNGYSTQAELCAFASWDAATWDAHPQMLENTAAWVAEEAAHFGIPLVHSTDHGVCQHVDVSGAGGHWDCGPAFPIDRVIAMAAGGAPAPTPPTPDQKSEETIVVSEVVKHRGVQLSCAQATNGQLWHKYSQDGGTNWRSEPLIRPNGQPVKATVKDTVSIAYVDGTLYITTEDEDNVGWMCRQTDDVTTGWDIRRLP